MTVGAALEASWPDATDRCFSRQAIVLRSRPIGRFCIMHDRQIATISLVAGSAKQTSGMAPAVAARLAAAFSPKRQSRGQQSGVLPLAHGA